MSGPSALPVGTVVGDLEIRGAIGHGGFGVVYEAHDPGLAIEVALKEYFLFGYSRRDGLEVHPKDEAAAEVFEAGKARFLREARLLAMLHERAVGRTESLVSVQRVFQANNTAYMVMRLYRGQTLGWRIKQKTQGLTQAWLVGVMLRLLDALESLHSLPGESLVHRDVSPENIIILPSGAPVLLDFGAARDSRQEMTAVIYRVGYSPVELYTDVHPSGPWTDLYSLCAIAYYAVCHQLPVEAISRLAGKKMPLATERGDAHFSQAFLRVIDKGMQVLPQDRYQDAAALRSALLEASAEPSGPGPVSPPVTAPVSAPEPVADDERTRVDTPSNPAPTWSAPSLAAGPTEVRTAAVVPAGQGGVQGLGHGAVQDAAWDAPPPPARRPWALWAASAAVLLLIAGAALRWAGIGRSQDPSSPPMALPATAAQGASTAAPASAAPAPSSPTTATATATAALPGTNCAPPDANWGCVLAGLVRTAVAPTGSSFELSTQSAHVGESLDAIVRSEQGGYVYLFSVDDKPQGQFALVFPNADDASNQIGAGAVMRLPRRPQWGLQALPPAGGSWFVAVVTSQVVPGWAPGKTPPAALEQALTGLQASDPWAPLGLRGCALAGGVCNRVRAVMPLHFEVR